MAITIGRFVHSGTTQSVGANANVLFESVTAPSAYYGYDNNGGIQIRRPGTYRIDATFTTVAASADPVTIQMYASNVPVLGSTASVVPAAIGDVLTMPINGVKTVYASVDGYATLNFRPSIATGVGVASVLVEKVA